jgi:putative Mg2+ transporter-C (MgtC) family protein
MLATVLGGLVGLEREYHKRPAGLRTNILVCIGAAMFGMVGVYAFQSQDAASRIIANIVVGIGFLGAGAVMKDEQTVHGLTTAATVWVVAALGVAIAVKFYFLAIASEVLILVTLYVLRRFEKRRSPQPPDTSPHR